MSGERSSYRKVQQSERKQWRGEKCAVEEKIKENKYA